MAQRSRPAPAPQRVYEDVEIPSRWETTKDADILVFDFTGFKSEEQFRREDLRVAIDINRQVKVRGERPLSGGGVVGRGEPWRRFQKVLRAPDGCNTSEIRAKFENGLLTVVMPKLVKEQPPSAAPPPAALPATAQAPSALPAKPEPAAAEPPATAEAPSTPPVKPEEEAAVPAARKAEGGKVGEPIEAPRDSRQKAPEAAKEEAAARAPYWDGKKDAAGDKEEAEKPAPGVQMAPPPTPAAKLEEPKQVKAEFGLERGRGRSRWLVAAAAMVVVAVVVAVGVGLYLSYRSRVGPDEPQASPPEGINDY